MGKNNKLDTTNMLSILLLSKFALRNFFTPSRYTPWI